MLSLNEENIIIDRIPKMSIAGLRNLFYMLYKEVGEYKINQWLNNFKNNTI